MITEENFIKWLTKLGAFKANEERVYLNGVSKALVFKLNFINPLAWVFAIFIWLHALYTAFIFIIKMAGSLFIGVCLYLWGAVKSPFNFKIKFLVYDEDNKND